MQHLELRDIRCFAEASLDPDAQGTTVLTGPNGSGKTTFLEAIGFLGTQRSFRTGTREAMVRIGQERGIVRGAFVREGRPLAVEAELGVRAGVRTLVNHRPVRARRELVRAVASTIFSPEDLGLVQGPPARRRELLDDALRVLDLEVGAALDELDRVLRQRGALLRQAGGRLSAEVATTLDVWDERFVAAGELVVGARHSLAADLAPHAGVAYGELAHPDGAEVSMRYQPSWSGALADAVAAARSDDVRRAATTVGPHRDEVVFMVDGRDARLHASQGEQRSLALALRLGMHQLGTDRAGSPPVLLLDDVFSELDPVRSGALVRLLPPGQALLTTAAPLPQGIEVAKVVEMAPRRREGPG